MQKDIELVDTEIMFLPEVAERVRESMSNIRVKVNKSRKGEYDFPLPISKPRERLAWLRSEIMAYLLRRNQQANHQQPQH